MSDVKLYQRFDGWVKYYEADVSRCDVCGKMFQIKKGFYLKDNILSCYKHDIKNGACEE